MNVAFLVNAFPKLSETFILNQITGLVDRGHDVDIYALQRPDEDPVHERISKYELDDATTYLADEWSDWVKLAPRVLRLTVEEIVRQPSFLRELHRQRRDAVRLEDAFEPVSGPLLDRLDRYDAIHAHFGPIGNGFRFVTEHTDAPFVISFYGYDVKEALDANPTRYRRLFASVDAVTVLSEDMREKVEAAGCPPEKTAKHPLCVDVGTFAFEERTHEAGEPYDVITVARFVEKKGLEYAVEAIARLTDQYDVRYHIAGDGPLRERIAEKIERQGIADSVELLGWIEQDEVSELMTDADVFLLPSVTAESGDQEGTPTVLLEAQAVGLPVISTYHAGIPEIVRDGQSGLLVPERDVDALARKLRTLFNHPERWPEMGRTGREYVEETHSIEAVTGGLETLYSDTAELSDRLTR